MKSNLVTVTILLVLSLCAVAQTKEQVILQLEEQFHKAKLTNDRATLEKLTAEGSRFFGQFESSAKFDAVDDRKAWINTWSSFKPTELTASDRKVIFFGENNAVVIGKLKEISQSNAGAPMYIIFRHVWAKIGTEWKFILQEHHFDATEGLHLPAGWDAAATSNFTIGLDPNVKRSGNSSLMIRSKHVLDKPLATGVGQEINAEPFRGKRIRLSGYVKGAVIYGYAFPWMRVNAMDGQVVSFDNVGTGFYVGNDWQRFAITLDVPENSLVINFGFQLNGRGQVWLDDWNWEIVGKDISSTSQLSEQVQKRNEFMARSEGQKAYYAEVRAKIGTYKTAPANLDFEAKK